MISSHSSSSRKSGISKKRGIRKIHVVTVVELSQLVVCPVLYHFQFCSYIISSRLRPRLIIQTSTFHFFVTSVLEKLIDPAYANALLRLDKFPFLLNLACCLFSDQKRDLSRRD